MSARMQGASPEAVERLHNAMNQHDLGAFLACFDRDYRSEQPAHPQARLGGPAGALRAWPGHRGRRDGRGERGSSATAVCI